MGAHQVTRFLKTRLLHRYGPLHRGNGVVLPP